MSSSYEKKIKFTVYTIHLKIELTIHAWQQQFLCTFFSFFQISGPVKEIEFYLDNHKLDNKRDQM